MTKEKIKELWNKIVVKDWKQTQITDMEDFDRLLYEVSNEIDTGFDVCWAGYDEQYLFTSYYSNKLGLNIELDLDCFERLDNADDLYEFIKRQNDWAREVETSITVKK
jgi:hypothetical protein